MKDIVIKIDRKTSQVFLNKKVLGISGENLQGNLIFEFIDDFVDGLAWLELETGQTKGYLALIKEDNSYKLPILSSLLASKGNITMQLRITENEDANGIPIFKSNMFYLEVKEAINSVKEIMEEYPNWFEQVNEKISVIQTDGKGNKYLSDDGTYKYVQGGSSDGGNVDLSNYATKDELDKKVDKVAGKSLIADSEIQRLASVSNYDDTSIRNELNSKADLSDIPAKISELTNDSGFITSIPMEYVTDEELNNKGYLTEHQDISHLANKNEIPTKTSELTNDSGFITDYTEKDPTVPSHVKEITISDISKWNNKSDFNGDYNSLANKPIIPSKTSELTNDSGFLTSVPSEYVTESEMNEAISNLGGGTGNVSSDIVNSIKVVDVLPEIEEEGVLYLVKESETEEETSSNLFKGSSVLLAQDGTKYNSPATFGGITYEFSANNPVITVSGTATSNPIQYFEQNNTLYAGKTYKLSYKYISGELNLGSKDYLLNIIAVNDYVNGTKLTGSEKIYVEATTESRLTESTFTLTEDVTQWWIGIQQRSSEVSCTNYAFEVIVEEV